MQAAPVAGKVVLEHRLEMLASDDREFHVAAYASQHVVPGAAQHVAHTGSARRRASVRLAFGLVSAHIIQASWYRS